MQRRLFNLLTALSLLLFATVLVLWVRSYFVSDERKWTTEYVDVHSGRVWNVDTEWVRSSRGWWSHGNYRSEPDAVYAYVRERTPETIERGQSVWRRGTGALPTTMSLWATRFGGELPVPYWLTALAFAILPARRVTAERVRRTLNRRRQEKIGLCPKCGYDLRATPGRCPECGTLATTPA